MDGYDGAEDGRYIVGPVFKALRTLDLVAESKGATLASLAPRLDLPRTTVFRYLRTLVAAGYLHHDGASDSYSVSARFRALQTQAAPALDRLKAAARPELERLRDRYDETINLGVRQGSDIVYVDVVESRQRLRILARVGAHDPLHSTALGRAILARMPEKECRRLLAGRLQRRTVQTLVAPSALEAALAAVRRTGYAVESGENEDGAACVSAALPPTGDLLAAISLSAPQTRLHADRFDAIGRDLIAAVHRIAGAF